MSMPQVSYLLGKTKRLVPCTILLMVLSSCGLVTGRETAAWLPDPEFSAQNSSLIVFVTDPLCQDKLQAEDVKLTITESEASVTITASVPNHSRGACKASGKSVPVQVELKDPIGDRILLDGGRNPPAPPVNDFGAVDMPILTD